MSCEITTTAIIAVPDRATAPRNPEELRAWLEAHVGMKFPAARVCQHHDTPFDYLAHSFLDGGDCVVWAPRGGGKTTLGAVATLLDVLHRPGCKVRILGGSLVQSMHMWDAFLPMLQDLVGEKELDGRIRASRVHLENGAQAAILTQSQRAVRGQRVQKVRCDEVELFDPRVWSAAQLTTRSLGNMPASIEALSTMHEPYGLMQKILDGAAAAGRRVFRWCILDVLEKCTKPQEECADCALFPECKGKLRHVADGGFMHIDDAIRMKHRVSVETWQAEMLCLKPSQQNAVFANFNPERHVVEKDWWQGTLALPNQRTLAIDFGYNDPFVCLWIISDSQGRTYVMDEYVQPQKTVAEHIEVLRHRHPGFNDVACDHAGTGINEQTGTTSIQLLRTAGYRVSSRQSPIIDGIHTIRAALAPAAGKETLHIHPRCRELIRSVQCYHFNGKGEIPKGSQESDHCCDALRYFFMNRPGKTEGRRY